MKILNTPLNGAFILKFKNFIDDRGSFSEKFNKEALKKLGIDFEVAQVNFATNEQSATVRGLHFQLPPFAQAKIVMCMRGSVMDCALDIQKNSQTFGQYFLCELTEGDGRALYIPEGMAHGYMTLKPNTDVMYLTSNFYKKENEAGVRYDDPFFSIKWPKIDNLNISDKDRSWPQYR